MKIKQRTLPGLGPIYEAFVVSLPFLSAIQFLTILALFYESIKVHLIPVFPWMTFSVFIIGVSLALSGIMVVVYKFLLPSLWTFRGKQLYGFESKLMDEIKKLGEEVKELKEGSGK